MNPDTRTFENETDATPRDWIRFGVGEILTIKGISMEIKKITKRDLTIRPLGQKILDDEGFAVRNPRKEHDNG